MSAHDGKCGRLTHSRTYRGPVFLGYLCGICAHFTTEQSTTGHCVKCHHKFCDTECKVAPFVGAFVATMRTMSDSNRNFVMQELRSEICIHCGGDAPCQCWNDE